MSVEKKKGGGGGGGGGVDRQRETGRERVKKFERKGVDGRKIMVEKGTG